MTRTEIRDRFRAENPEITERVLTDSQLNSWLIEGNKNFCCKTLLIQKSGTIHSVADEDTYNLLTSFTDFYEVDEFPGGGIAYNGKRIDIVTKAELDNNNKSWRSNSSGTPKKCYRKMSSIVLDRPSDTTDIHIDVDYFAIPDSFSDDALMPFNNLAYLQAYDYALVLYLQGRAKMVVGKQEEKAYAMAEYENYVNWCKKQVGGGKFGKIEIVSPYNAPSRSYPSSR